ncbi:hypothetical protein K438DRAFT_375094 [Mycena galopus ATCC 62051]|nr:hypothetical protein K438DRAFT_375094 [Mycena galopus ATCC 62051]
MRRIPDDILREIFVTCLPTAPNLIDPAEAPILLGCICRHWRAVAHTTPILWSSIHISALPRVSAEHGAEILSRVLERWLQRAATCPLTVSVTDNGLHDSHPDTNLISLLINCSQRLQHLALVGDTGALLPFLRLPPESLPLLQSIRLHARGDSPFTEYPDAMNVLHIPGLTAIALKVKTNPLSLPLK